MRRRWIAQFGQRLPSRFGKRMENRKLLVMHSNLSQDATTASLLVVTTVFLAADGEHDKYSYFNQKIILSTKPR